MEYAVEMNRLIQLQMEGTIGREPHVVVRPAAPRQKAQTTQKQESIHVSVIVKEAEATMQTAAGFSEATVRAHSAARGEPEWMLQFPSGGLAPVRGAALAKSDG
jgi:hypothetical protein